MTTWQDQQPMSRRALRESERAHAQATMSDTGDLPTVETHSDQQIWPQPLTAEPLGYATQARPATPVDEPPLRRPRSSGTAPVAPESPAYRVRDFSPEGRGTSFSSTAPAPWTPPAAGSGDLDYHTSVEFNRAAPEASERPTPVPPVVGTAERAAQASPAPATTAHPRHDGPVEHTLTRRELRELRNASAAAPEASPAPSAAVGPVAVPPDATVPLSAVRAPQLQMTEELAAAMAEFDALFLAKSSPPPLVEPSRAASHAQPAAAPVAQPPVAAPAPPARPVATPPPAPVAAPPAATPPAAPVQAEIPAEPLREIVTAPEVYAAPAGHWSTELTADDQFADLVGAHSRNLAAVDAITTNALVLPAFPQTGPLTGPVSRTGEILLTGSIDLPRSLGLNGMNPGRYDRPDIDAVIDAGDREDSAPDSAPVRAIRAVSTHTSSQGIINTKRPKGSSLPMILSITAGVMAVGVIVLFVAGMIFKIF